MSPFLIRKTKIRELPFDNDNFTGISSDWAYDHEALKTAHGISSFGSTLVDDADAPTARSTLGTVGWTISSSAPLNPNAGDVWWDTESGLSYVWYVGTNSSQWVSNGSAGKPFSYPIDDTPENGIVDHSISSNWAFDHAATTTAHGISSFGATLVDDLDAGTARSTLGLGTIATHASTEYEVVDATILRQADVDDTPVDGVTTAPVSSNWAFDHAATALAHSITGAAEITTDLADGDEVPVYDLSTTTNKKSLLSRFWTYISSKLSSYTGALTGSSLTVSGSDEPTYGAELLTSAGWTVGGGWTEAPDDTFTHTGGGGTATLVHSATIANATKYQLTYTITGRTAGTVTITFGGQTSGAVSASGAIGPTTSSTAAFTVTPTTEFDGVCVFSLKEITGGSTPRLVVKDAGSVTILEARGKDAVNTFVGVDAGRYCTTGSSNVGMGSSAQRSLTTGANNVGMGTQAQYSLTTGGFNVGMGHYAQLSLTTGSSNVGMGHYVQYNLTVGTGNVGMGPYAQHSLTTGNYNVGIGHYAGSYHADGATALTDPEYSVYIGANARGKDNSDANSVVIGGNTPIGLGANTTVIGTSATTLTRLYGDVATGVDAPSAAVHAIKTTEQLRLGYDATKYVSHTVDSSGNVLIDAVGTVKIGETSNHVQIATDGTLTLVGTATAWDDLQIPGHAVKVTGASPPELAGGFAGDATLDLYVFDGVSTLEQVFFTVQMPHRWKEGSTIYPHVHVSPTSTNTGDTNERVVRFGLEYTWANIGDTFGATNTLPLDTDAFVPNTSQWKHLICKNGTGIAGTGKTLSSMLVCRLFRDPSDSADTYPQDVAFLHFDIHYEVDSFGSSSEYTK